jgi:hypothetical protein
LGELAERVRPVTLAEAQTLPLLPALDALVPAGLRRGSTVLISGRGSGVTSLALALAAGPSAHGSWVAAVGVPSLGLVAAAELGVSLERLALVADPAGVGAQGVATVVATLVDAFDVVLLGSAHRLRTGDARRLAARVRERGAVLVPFVGACRAAPPGLAVDLRLTITASTWEGVGDGHGHLRGRRVVVEADGRGAAARSRRGELWLPGPDGGVAQTENVECVERVAPVVSLRETG